MSPRVVRVLIALLLCGLPSRASAALVAGDIAIIAYNSNSADDFAWVALTNIAANTSIKFTDSSWQGTSPGSFRSGESGGATNPLTWTSSSSVAAGTVIRYTGTTTNTWSIGTRTGNTWALSTGGDQIFAFTGTATSPTFLYGIDFANTGWTVGSTSNSNSASNIPGGLSSGSTANYTGNWDNGYYSGSTAGTKAQILANIANSSNWTLRNNTAYSSGLWKSSFTLAPSTAPEPSSLLMAGVAAIVSGMAYRRRGNRNESAEPAANDP